jgi:hypothetical protein
MNKDKKKTLQGKAASLDSGRFLPYVSIINWNFNAVNRSSLTKHIRTLTVKNGLRIFKALTCVKFINL